MNTYIVTIMDKRSYDTFEIEVEAESTQDALTMADFNVCRKDTDDKGRPNQRTYHIKAKGTVITQMSIEDAIRELIRNGEA
jgi:hypothetical protein